MMISAFSQLPLFAAASGTEPAVPVVVVTGLSLVFAILLILIVIVILQGAIFKSIEKRKHERETAAQAPQAPAQAAPTAAAAPAAVAEEMAVAAVAGAVAAMNSGIPGEVVAAITAAVAAFEGEDQGAQAPMGGTTVIVQAPRSRRGRWGNAGVLAGTEPF